MIYLVKYTNTSHTVPGSTKETAYWKIIEEVCQSDSLVDINKYLMKKDLPIINHDECLHIMRDYKLKKILNEN